MNKLLLLLMTALLALPARGESLPAYVADADIMDTTSRTLTLSRISNEAQTIIQGKRSLRSPKTTDFAPGEERAMAEFAEKLKAWAPNTKLGRTIQSWLQKRSQVKAVKRVNLIKSLAEKNFDNYNAIYRRKITPDEYFEAMKYDHRLRFASETKIAAASQFTPGLKKWEGYEKFYYRKLQEELERAGIPYSPKGLP